jgi:hypothetical protein
VDVSATAPAPEREDLSLDVYGVQFLRLCLEAVGPDRRRMASESSSPPQECSVAPAAGPLVSLRQICETASVLPRIPRDLLQVGDLASESVIRYSSEDLPEDSSSDNKSSPVTSRFSSSSPPSSGAYSPVPQTLLRHCLHCCARVKHPPWLQAWHPPTLRLPPKTPLSPPLVRPTNLSD